MSLELLTQYAVSCLSWIQKAPPDSVPGQWWGDLVGGGPSLESWKPLVWLIALPIGFTLMWLFAK